MKTETVKIGNVKSNPNNPRVIKDDNFRKLVNSIKEFPKMLKIRPIVVNDDMIVLGGNMRLKACKEAGLKEVPIIKASDLTEDEQRQFIIKDNVSGGEWDWDMLTSDWDTEKLEEWGLELPYTEDDITEMHNPDNEETENKFATELDSESNYLVLKFDKDIDWVQAKTLFGLQTETARRANGKAWSSGIGRVLNGTDAIKKIQNES